MYAFFHSMAGSGAGSPPLTNLWGWWHAGEVYSDTACTVRQTTDAGVVAGLLDLSGAGRNFTQSTGANQPSLRISQLNGLPAIRFDGSNDNIRGGSGLVKTFTVFVVYKNLAFSSEGTIFDSTDGNERSKMGQYSTGNVGIRETSSAEGAHLAAPLNAYHLGAARFAGSASSWHQVDSSAETAYTGSAGGVVGIVLGSRQDNNQFNNMDWVEMMVYSASLSSGSGDGLLARRYLNDKYNLGLVLGAASPPLTNLWGWWNANEVYSDTSCLVRQTTNGGSIAGILDLSGNGRNFTQGTGSLQPVLDVARNAIDFDGTNDFFERLGPNLPLTTYVVVEFDTWANNNTVLNHRGGGDEVSTRQLGSSPQVGIDYNGGPGAYVNATLGSKRLIGSSYNSTTGVGTLIVDTTSTTVGSLPTSPSLQDVFFGSGNGGNGFLDGKVSEVLIYTGIHTFGSGDGLLVRQFLNTKYNLGLGI